MIIWSLTSKIDLLQNLKNKQKPVKHAHQLASAWIENEYLAGWGQSPFLITVEWEQLDGIKFCSWQQASALSSVKFHCDLHLNTMVPQHPGSFTVPIKWHSEQNLANDVRFVSIVGIISFLMWHTNMCQNSSEMLLIGNKKKTLLRVSLCSMFMNLLLFVNKDKRLFPVH